MEKGADEGEAGLLGTVNCGKVNIRGNQWKVRTISVRSVCVDSSWR